MATGFPNGTIYINEAPPLTPSSGGKGYYFNNSVWYPLRAEWDGSTVTAGTVTTLASTTINATTVNATVMNPTTVNSTTLNGTTVNATTLNGTLGTAAQPSITSVGSLTSLDVNGAGDLSQSGTGVTFKAGASNASYATELCQLVATRAATTAYKFLATRSSGGGDVEHNLRGNGDGLCDGAWTGGGADFAEFMEWADENPNNEDRTGMTVAVAVQDTSGHITPKIKLAEAGDVVIGAVSAAPTLVGNSDWNRWQGKWLKTKYGAYDLDAEGNRQLNPAWNGSTYEEHIPRDERKEWAKIGIVGFVIIDDGQVTGNNWINFGSLGQGVSRWLLK